MSNRKKIVNNKQLLFIINNEKEKKKESIQNNEGKEKKEKVQEKKQKPKKTSNVNVGFLLGLNANNKKTTKTSPIEEGEYEISGEYSGDYDITTIDKKVKEKLEREKIIVSEKLEKLEWIKEESVLESDRIEAEKLIEEIEREELDCLEGKVIKNYKKKSRNLVGTYKRITGSKKEEIFGKKRQELSEEDKIERDKTVSKYLSLAKNYITLSIIKKQEENETVCENCKLEGKIIELSYDADESYCERCGMKQNKN